MDKQLRTRFATPKPKYRVTNWRDYNAALVQRGSLTLWIDETVIDRWHAVSGKGAVYHDDAILCALSLRSVFGLALRQTQGFLHSLAAMLELGVEVPHYSTLSRRASGLKVPAQCLNRHNQPGPLHLVIDSTGLKVFGEGEWKVRVHGVGKRRVWRKLHLGVDQASGEIPAHDLTMNNVHDGPILPGLLDQVDSPIDQVSADTAYDSFRCHRAICDRHARPVIPPRKGASILPPRNLKDPPPTRHRPGAGLFNVSIRSDAKNGKRKAIITDDLWPRLPCSDSKPSLAQNYTIGNSKTRRQKPKSEWPFSTPSLHLVCPKPLGLVETSDQKPSATLGLPRNKANMR